MKVANLKEEMTRSQVIEQLNKLDYHDTDDKSLYKLVSILSKLRFRNINHDSSDSVWFE